MKIFGLIKNYSKLIITKSYNFTKKIENNIINSDELISIKNINLAALKRPEQLFFIREFIEGFIKMNSNKNKEAEVHFENLKEILRKTHIASYPYSLIIRRLGIVKLQQNKIKEGLLEMENFFEFSKIETHNPEYQFNALLDLLKSYIYYNSSKVSFLN